MSTRPKRGNAAAARTRRFARQHDSAAGQYEQLAMDDRLSLRDRARARMWVGTALSKNGNHDYAASVMRAASRDFENLSEVKDWLIAQQKLALAHRGAGDLSGALHFIDIARSTSALDSPMQRVRLDTAHGHILLSDPATATNGLAVLAAAAGLAAKYGMSHRLQSIDGIRRDYGRRPALGRR
ncbi:hypothetical protein [Kitasatospora sp. NPDC001547]|uniref:hypothetical protein n=1 Tax=Kitasatospora sp. NPDC001547 TaxID=3364015 RepID=UPI0036B53956